MSIKFVLYLTRNREYLFNGNKINKGLIVKKGSFELKLEHIEKDIDDSRGSTHTGND